MDNRIWRTNKNKSESSVTGVFLRPVEKAGERSFQAVFKDKKKRIFSAAVTVHEQHGIQKQQIRAMLNLKAAFDLSLYVRAARFQPTKTNHTELRQVTQDHDYTAPHLKALLFKRIMAAFIDNLTQTSEEKPL